MKDQEGATLGIGAVARRTGLTPDVLRIWERRHQAVAPDRSQGGTRFYTERQVRRLEVLAGLISRGHRIGRLAALTDEDLAVLLDSGGPVEPAEAAPAPSIDSAIGVSRARAPEGWLEEAIESVRAIDTGELDDQMRGLFLALGPRRFTLEVALPLLARVGDLWAAGEIMIASEHATSAVLRSLLGGALGRHRHRPSAQHVIFGTPAGQQHELGALAAALLAANHGVDVIFLGVELPCEEFARAVEKTHAQAVVLGLCPYADEAAADSAGRFIETLRGHLSRDVVIGVGGAADLDRMRSLGVLVFDSLSAFDGVVGRFGRVPSPSLLGMNTSSGWHVVDSAP